MSLDKYSRGSVAKWNKSSLISNKGFYKKNNKSMKKQEKLKIYGATKSLIQEN